MAANTSPDFKFTYPSHAKEFPKRVSPLEQWYSGSEPPGTIISGGVVTSDNVKRTSP